MSAITFGVIDTTCEQADKRFFPPRINLITVGHVTVRTRHGYPEYQHLTGDLYKTLTYAGSARQVAETWPNIAGGIPPTFCAGAEYIYSGASQIDVHGNFISHHRKDLNVPCVNNHPWPTVENSSDEALSQLIGYCWPADPDSCPACDSDNATWDFKGDFSDHSPHDYPSQMLHARHFTSVTPLVAAYNSGAAEAFTIHGTTNFPQITVNAVYGGWVTTTYVGNWSATLSDPFTAADELAGQVLYTNASAIAATKPNRLSWVKDYVHHIESFYCSVDFTLNCTNLLAGESYTVRYELWDSDGTKTIPAIVFTATGNSHVITGTIPTPATNHTIQIKNPHIDRT